MAKRAIMEDFDGFNVWLAHGLSGAAILGTIVGWLPPLAALIALVWYVIQIGESKTVRGLFARRRERKIARLKAKLTHLEITKKDIEKVV